MASGAVLRSPFVGLQHTTESKAIHFISVDRIDGLEAVIQSDGYGQFAEKHPCFLQGNGDGDGGENGGCVISYLLPRYMRPEGPWQR